MVLGSGIRKKPIPDPGSRIQGSKSTRSRIPDPDPQHCSFRIRIFSMPDLGVKKTPDPGSESATLILEAEPMRLRILVKESLIPVCSQFPCSRIRIHIPKH
jgi:hypothetical protein